MSTLMMITFLAFALVCGISLGYALFSWDGGDNDDDIHGNSGGLSHA